MTAFLGVYICRTLAIVSSVNFDVFVGRDAVGWHD